jgi:ADP-heptose:LPS heptosyltransferase
MNNSGVLRRRLGIVRDLAGNDDQRHQARARLRAARLRYGWELRNAVKRSDSPWVLVGLIEHLGDIVAAEPIARHLRQTHPDARIAWAVRRPYRELLDTHPCIDLTIEVGCLTEWMALRDSSAFDDVVDLHIPQKHCPSCRIKTTALPHHGGIAMENYYFHGSLLEIYCKCGNLPPLHDGPLVYLTDHHRERVDTLNLPDSFIAIHASSNQVERDWDASKWEALAASVTPEVPLVELGTTPLLRSQEGVIDLCGRLTILESAEVIRRAVAFVGVDSGPAHLANAVSTYGIIMLGHYRAYTRYMPYSGAYADGSNARVLHHHGPAFDLPVAEVQAALAPRLAAMQEHAYG